jgi:cellobiose phosphorylase
MDDTLHLNSKTAQTRLMQISKRKASSSSQSGQTNGGDGGSFGTWIQDDQGLPAFRFDARLPVSTRLPDGFPARVPDDPWFLVGNDGTKLFVHASGSVQWLSGVREWARLNWNGKRNGSAGSLRAFEGSSKRSFIGASPSASSVERLFGCGFARWRYRTAKGLVLEHRIECPPSVEKAPRPNQWIETISLRNESSAPIECSFVRELGMRYGPITLQHVPAARHPVVYKPGTSRCSKRSVEIPFTAMPSSGAYESLDPATSSPIEWHPPAIRCESFGREIPSLQIRLSGNACTVGISAGVRLEPGETRSFAWVWSALHGGERLADAPTLAAVSGWRRAWARAVPDFPNESDAPLRREMRWHSAMLLSLATWSSVYGVRFIPQGPSYEYDFGITCSARDHLQHALPLCQLMPWLASDTLRHACRKMTPNGEIRLMENGPGSTTTAFFATSDQQLYFFGLLAEYLDTSGDAAFLGTKLAPWPPDGHCRPVTVLEHAERAFRFLRDEVGRGSHGLVRLMNSDWNDGIYCASTAVPYADMFLQSESHLNTAQACVVLDQLGIALKRSARLLSKSIAPRALILSKMLRCYRAELHAALMKEWKGRSFLARAHTPAGCLGADQMWMEPQVFALGIKDAPLAKRRLLLREMQRRLSEPWGMRQQENPVEIPPFKTGGRENGGVWFALIGPAIVHAAEVDRKVAERLFQSMTLAAHARRFPDYWPGIWTAPDNFDSSLLPTVGLPDQQSIWPEFPAFCSHAHAWPLFAYLKLRKARSLE